MHWDSQPIQISQPYPGKPTITHAEFPCTLVYELNGEEITLTDTIICEYDGIEYDDSSMTYRRQWTEDFRSGDGRFTLAEYDNGSCIVFHYQNVCEYLMGDTDYSGYAQELDSGVFRIAASGHGSGFIEEDILYNDYGIRIVSFEYGPPIENTFQPATRPNHSCVPSDTILTAEYIPAN